MKKWMLCALCLVFLLSIAGCGSAAKAAPEELITLTLTPQYARDVTDAWLDENVDTVFQSFQRHADGSIVLNMTPEQYAGYVETIRLGILSAAQSMVENDRNNITDISFNDDFSAIQVTVNTDTLLPSDADSANTFSAYGRFYHYLTTQQYLTTGLEDGLEDYSVAITYLDAAGNILEENDSPE